MPRPWRALLLVALSACGRDLRVEDLSGRALDPFAGPERVRAFVFLSTDCPISNRYAPDLRVLHDRYTARGVRFEFVYPDAASDASAVRAHLAAYALPTRALRDPRHLLARRSAVTITPEAAVYSRGALVYHGRIDDRFVSYNRERPRPLHRELIDALDAALADRAPAVSTAPAIGCTLTDTP